MALGDNSKTAMDSKDSKESSKSLAESAPAALSKDAADPLNWPLWLKIVVLLQVAVLAALGGLNTAIINPAYVPLSKEFRITTVQASYQTTVVIALNGIAPFIWIPFANVYGRRPVYLLSTLLGFVSALGSAYAKNYGQLLAARVFNGLFPSAFALGAATVMDLFPVHQRGRAMGLYTVMMTNGSHLAPIIGGLTGQYLGWRWCFKMAAIIDAFMLLVISFCLSETLYIRDIPGRTTQRGPYSETFTMRTYLATLKPKKHHGRHLRLDQFVWPSLKMARYPSVVFPALYYGAQYGFASILPAVTVASIFTEFFHWSTLGIGLAYGGALTIGSFLGELAAGPVLDRTMKRARRHNPSPPPEVRLRSIWPGEVLVPAGLLIYGFCLQFHTAWIAPLIGMAVACFGLQIVTTTCYTYATECHRAKSSEVAQFFNLVRQEIGMTFAFYTIALAERIGYDYTFLIFAIAGSVLGFAPIAVLMWRGEEVRQWAAGEGDMVEEEEIEKDQASEGAKKAITESAEKV